jgi:hypothetical protein
MKIKYLKWQEDITPPSDGNKVLTRSGRVARSASRTLIPTFLLANVRSINNKLDEITLALNKASADVFIFTETWLCADVNNSFLTHPNYQLFREDRNSEGGGIAVFVRNNFQAIKVNMTIEATDLEILSLYLPTVRCLVIAIYHPYWGFSNKHELACDSISHLIDDTLLQYKLSLVNLTIVVAGDFNDLRLHFSKCENVYNLTQIVTFPTRGPNTLDNIYTNHPHYFAIPEKLPPFGRSDHAAVLCRALLTKKVLKIKKSIRKYTPSNKAHFRRLIVEEDWLSSFSLDMNADRSALALQSKLLHLFDTAFPLKIVNFSNLDKPWMTPEIKMLLEQRDRAYTENKGLKYIRLKERVIQAIKNAKKAFVKRCTTEHPRRLWEVLNKVCRKESPSVYAQVNPDEINATFLATQNPPCSSIENIPVDTLVQDLASSPIHLDEVEVLKRLQCIKKKSAGPDSYPHWILRDFADILCVPIAKLFNICLSECIMPVCFKEATIVPIPKSGSSTPEYRPISLLAHLSKVLENIVIDHWFRPRLLPSLSSNQFAFTGNIGGGTTNALLKISDSVLRHLDSSSGATRLLLVDFSKAFDKAQKDRIIQSLATLGASRECVLWINNFLSDRKQRVSIHGKLSTWRNVISGVPQGSVLGPVLFAILVDSLKPVHPKSQYVKYADDITVLHNIRDQDDDHLQLEWDAICKWSADSMLPINFKKTCILDIITKKGLTLKRISSPDNTLLDVVHNTKLLGVVVSDNLKWDEHIQYCVTKASKSIYILIILKSMGVDQHHLWQAYCAFTRSILTYAYPVYCNVPQRLYAKLQKVESRAKRIIGSDPPTKLDEFCGKICQKLSNKIKKSPIHPLHYIFDKRRPHGRNLNIFCPPFAKTARFSNSFIKFA